MDRAALEEQFDFYEGVAATIYESKRVSCWEAWAGALRRTMGRGNYQTLARHPSKCLLLVMHRYGAYNGATTSGVEQAFSLQQKLLDGRSGSLGLELDEMKIVVDCGSTASEVDDLARGAQEVWRKCFGNARKSAKVDSFRLDKGLKRKGEGKDSEASLLKKRRAEVAAIATDASSKEIMAAATRQGRSQWNASLAKEQRFVGDKLLKEKIEACMDGVLLPKEESAGLKAVCVDWAQLQAATDKQRQQKSSLAQSRVQRRKEFVVSEHRFFLEAHAIPELQAAVRKLRLRVVGSRTEATVFVAADAAKPGQRSKWAVAVNGGLVVDPAFVSSAGAHGVSFAYQAAVGTSRKIWASDAFTQSHSEIWDIVSAGAALPQSKWRLLSQLEWVHAAQNSKSFDVIALITPGERAARAPQNIVLGGWETTSFRFCFGLGDQHDNYVVASHACFSLAPPCPQAAFQQKNVMDKASFLKLITVALPGQSANNMCSH